MSCILSMLPQIRVKEKPKSDIVSAWYKKRQIYLPRITQYDTCMLTKTTICCTAVLRMSAHEWSSLQVCQRWGWAPFIDAFTNYTCENF